MQEIGLLEHCNRIFIIIFIFFSNLFPQNFPDSTVHFLLTSGINEIIKENYDDAEKIFINLNQSYPNLPLGKIYLAAVEITKSSDFDIPFNNDKIKKYLNDAKNLSEKLLKKNNTDIWNIYFYALTKGYKAYFEALNQNYLSAFSDGLDSYNYFSKSLNIDSNFTEAFIAIGSYKYWKSKKTDFLNWLPFIQDEREIGINYLLKSISKPSYNFHLAVYSLIWIYIDNKESEKVINLFKQIDDNRLNSRFFMWALARAYEDIDKKMSTKIYLQILDSYKKEKNYNRVNEITLKHKIAQNYFRLGDKENTIKYCNDILSYKNLTSYEKDKLNERIKRVKKLKEDCYKKD